MELSQFSPTPECGPSFVHTIITGCFKSLRGRLIEAVITRSELVDTDNKRLRRGYSTTIVIYFTYVKY
jgi:hypothetical protein